jgi:hypothetical protein
MLDSLEALCAHARCKKRLAYRLGQEKLAADFREFSPDENCAVVRFIRDGEKAFGSSPEICRLKEAHATVHSVAIGLAQKRAAGQKFDVEYELGSHSNFGAASSSLISAIWRLDQRVHSVAS